MIPRSFSLIRSRLVVHFEDLISTLSVSDQLFDVVLLFQNPSTYALRIGRETFYQVFPMALRYVEEKPIETKPPVSRSGSIVAPASYLPGAPRELHDMSGVPAVQ